MNIAFSLISTGYREDAIAQLVHSLAPYPVIIHHDFSLKPDFRLELSNGYLVPNAQPSGWGDWGFVTGIIRTMEFAVANFEFDYLQLLSPTCLPIRPVEEFAEHLAGRSADVFCEPIPLDSDADARLNYVHRIYFPNGSLRQRALTRARAMAMGKGYRMELRSGLAIARARRTASGNRTFLNLAGISLASAIDRGLVGRHLFNRKFRPFMGSTWICARRHVLGDLIKQAKDPAVVKHFQRGLAIDECFFASLIANADFTLAPINTFVNDFDQYGHPNYLTEHDLPKLVASGKFFARKFHDDPNDPARLAVLSRLAITRSLNQVSRFKEPVARPEPGRKVAEAEGINLERLPQRMI